MYICIYNVNAKCLVLPANHHREVADAFYPVKTYQHY